MAQLERVSKPGKARNKIDFALGARHLAGFFAVTSPRAWSECMRAPEAVDRFTIDRRDCPEFRQLSGTSTFSYTLGPLFSITYGRQSNCTTSGARLQTRQMLRIQREANGQIVFTISGQLNWDNLTELKKLIEESETDRRIVLDLRELTLVDQDAVRFLRQCESEGIELKNCPPYVCEWIARQRDGN